MPVRRQIACFSVALVLGGASGCSGVSWQRWLYDLGDQYACMQANSDRRAEQAADVACTNPAHPTRTRYADYQGARETESGDPQP